jgi:hypothetical protein
VLAYFDIQSDEVLITDVALAQHDVELLAIAFVFSRNEA